MGHIGIAVVAGLLAGLAAGGRPATAALPPLRWPAALLAGVAGQVVAEVAGLRGATALAVVLAAYGALVLFAVANVLVTGVALLLIGLTLNLTSMVLHGGMPVGGDALVAAGVVEEAELAGIDLGAKRHLATGDEQAPWLGDVLPVAPLRQVLSVGDVVLAAGLAAVVFRALRPRPDPVRVRRDVPAAAGDGVVGRPRR